MSILHMGLVGTHSRPCPVCGATQTPKSDEHGNAIPMTAHEEECINKALAAALLKASEYNKSPKTKENTMTEFTKYRRSQIAELRPYVEGEDMSAISVSGEDTKAGSPKAGDMIARNPKNHLDQWLVAAKYFADNFEPA